MYIHVHVYVYEPHGCTFFKAFLQGKGRARSKNNAEHDVHDVHDVLDGRLDSLAAQPRYSPC
jgi:hypothetical protein